jgi:sugar phosphate isomerase/epimerase
MLTELAELGFAYAELSHGVRMSLVPGILKAVEDGVIQISSVHNFCPLPIGVMGAAPNLYEPAAASRRERILWLHNTLKTIDFTARVGSECIVLHSGRARYFFGDPSRKFEDLWDKRTDGMEAQLEAQREKVLRALRKKARSGMKRLEESLGLIVERAKERGVKLGLENREGMGELPLDEEMLPLQERLKEHEVFGYWHDSGHAQIKDRMGLLEHGPFLESLRPHLLGFHLHDVTEDDHDHQIPGTGTIDWAHLASQVRDGDVVVAELSPRLRPEEVMASRDFLLQTLPLST